MPVLRRIRNIREGDIVITVGLVNAMGVSTGAENSQRIFRQMLRQAPTFILGSECADFWAEDVSDEYEWAQYGRELGDPATGLVLGVRKDSDWSLAASQYRTLSQAESNARGSVRDRGVVVGVARHAVRIGLRLSLVSGHSPPRYTPRAHAAYQRAFAQIRATLKGGDMNQVKRYLARLWGRVVVGEGVLYLALPIYRWRLHKVEVIDPGFGADHNMVLVTLVFRPRRRQR